MERRIIIFQIFQNGKLAIGDQRNAFQFPLVTGESSIFYQ